MSNASNTTKATRVETDSFGPIEVDAERYWGAQTERSRRFFAIGEEQMPRRVIVGLARIKLAAARVNAALGQLDRARAALIEEAAQEVIDGVVESGGGVMVAEFPLSVWQTGSGTQSNMNVNEVIANRCNEKAGKPRGGKAPVHPNDHVNLGQSSNDAFPTAMHLAISEAIAETLLPAVAELRATLHGKAEELATVVKIGRTHLQDATPITLGQEISGWVAQLDHATTSILASLPALHELAIGGTAVGTGLNSHPEFAVRMAAELSAVTGRSFVTAPNKFAALAGHEAVVAAHGALRTLATSLFKIANDVRWLASGPRAGLGELLLPENEPGSSIMPGKVNPTQCEAMTMVCAQVMGNDVAIGLGGASGNFQLNVYKPMLAHVTLQSVRLLGDACRSFDQHCARGLEPNRAVIERNLHASLMLVTALAPHVGYDKAAKIAKQAHAEGLNLKEAALAQGVSAEQFAAWVKVEELTKPG